MIDTQRPGFEELYRAFYDFFLESIRKDASPWNKIKLQMMSQYFDDLALYKVINPIIVRISSNPEDRRSIARAALWDAWQAHLMSQMFSSWSSMKDTVPERAPVKIISEPPAAVVTVPEETATASSGGVTEIRLSKAKAGRVRRM